MPRTPPGFSVARLRIALGRHSWCEKFFVGPVDPAAWVGNLNWLCAARAVWLGTGCSITFASVSDLGPGRDGAAADYLPYTNPYSAFNGPVADPDIGYQYRMEAPSPADANETVWQNRLFRGVPSRWISNEAIVGAPFGQLGPASDWTALLPFDTLRLGGGNANQAGNSLVNFLLANTGRMYFDTGTLTWHFASFNRIVYRRMSERRAGAIFGSPKGRFTQ